MFNRKSLSRLIVCVLVSTLAFSCTSPVISIADDKTDQKVSVSADKQTSKPRVVVSMGDSYSSGEGIEPFYGNSDPDSKYFAEWLAHRSTESWAGELELPGLGKLKDHKVNDDSNYKKDDKLQWYFVASSGAEIKDICGYEEVINGKKVLVGQKKDYSKYPDYLKMIGQYYGGAFDATYVAFLKRMGVAHTVHLGPQIEVLNELKKQDIVPDYITITIGGNDVGFGDIIYSAAVKSNYLNLDALAKDLNKARLNLSENSEFRKNLNKVYHDINEASSIGDRKPCILVAGYPGLLDKYGRGLPFNISEAQMINTSVEDFNKAIKEEVEKCKKDMNIEFVDVLPKFSEHEAYSSNAWINGIKTIPRNQDLNECIVFLNSEGKPDVNLVSASSMHPNKTGAHLGYAKCFQEIITKLEVAAEAKRSKETAVQTTEPTKTSESVPESETSSEQPAPESVTIKVTDAVNKSFKDERGSVKWPFRFPKVTISGVDTSDANNTIKKEINIWYSGSNKNNYAAEYKYFISKKVVSVLVARTDIRGGEDTVVYVFNIDVSTGKLISVGELVKLYGITDKEFFSKIKNLYEIFNKAEIKKGMDKEWINENLKHVSYSYIHPYINNKEHLCFMGETNWYGGAGNGYTSFDLSTKKYYQIHFHDEIKKAK